MNKFKICLVFWAEPGRISEIEENCHVVVCLVEGGRFGGLVVHKF